MRRVLPLAVAALVCGIANAHTLPTPRAAGVSDTPGCTVAECRQVLDRNGDGNLSAEIQEAFNALAWPGGTLTSAPVIQLAAPPGRSYGMEARIIFCPDDTPPTGSTAPDCDGTGTLPVIEMVGDWAASKLTPTFALDAINDPNLFVWRVGDSWRYDSLIGGGGPKEQDGAGSEIAFSTVDTQLRFGAGPDDALGSPTGSFSCMGCTGKINVDYEDGDQVGDRANFYTGEGASVSVEAPSAAQSSSLRIGGSGAATIAMFGPFSVGIGGVCAFTDCGRVNLSGDTNVSGRLTISGGDVSFGGGRFSNNTHAVEVQAGRVTLSGIHASTTNNAAQAAAIRVSPSVIGALEYLQLSSVTAIGGPGSTGKSIIDFDSDGLPAPTQQQIDDETLWPRIYVDDVFCRNPNTATGTSGDSQSCIGGRTASTGGNAKLPMVIEVTGGGFQQGLPDRPNSIDMLGQDQINSLDKFGRHYTNRANLERHTNEERISVLADLSTITPGNLPQCLQREGSGLVACGSPESQIPTGGTRWWISRYEVEAIAAAAAGVSCGINLLYNGALIDDAVSEVFQTMVWSDAGDFASPGDWIAFWLAEPAPRGGYLEFQIKDDGGSNCTSLRAILHLFRSPRPLPRHE